MFSSLFDIARFSPTSPLEEEQFKPNLDIQGLLKLGADVDERNYFGDTPLIHAAEQSRFPIIIETLLDAGADVNARNFKGQTPLMCAALNQSKFAVDIMRLLIDRGADINAADNEGKTALIMAVNSRDPKKVETLMLDKIAINQTSDNGFSPLMWAIQLPLSLSSTLDICGILLRHGATPNFHDSQGNTLLQIAQNLKSAKLTDKARLLALLRSHGARD